MDWTITYKGFDKQAHPLQEALTTLGNGYFATRGALEMIIQGRTVEQLNSRTVKDAGSKALPSDTGSDQAMNRTAIDDCIQKDWNYPGTYLAGGYNRLESKVKEKVIENEDLVNWPNWLFLTFSVDEGRWFDPERVEMLDYKTNLLLNKGALERTMRFRDDHGRVSRLSSRRLVSMHDKHIAAIQWQFTPENWSGNLRIMSGIDGCVINDNVERYSDLNQDHIVVIEKGRSGSETLVMLSRTKQSRIEMAQAVRTRVFACSERHESAGNLVEEKRFIANEYAVPCEQGKTIHIEKVCALYTSRDQASSDPITESLEKIARAGSFKTLEEDHTQSWTHIWHFNDLVLDSDNAMDQLVLRLHVFHLYQTVSHNSIDHDIGIPARGWHGEAYRGHIFWDELYILPYINLHYPQLSRSLLMYRYRRLNEARHAAREAGFRGAMFPWQSGSNGREETQKIHLNPDSGRWLPDVSHLQYHINAAIPYNVWHYYQSTGDMDFLLSHGAEIILSTALFWSGIATYNEQTGRFGIHRVMGPDEYHTHYPNDEEPGLNNNAYTNIMSVWVIQRALDLLELLDETCCNQLEKSVGYTKQDIQRWKKITKKMFVPIQNNGLILQFEGYERLEELDWDHYHKKHGQSLRLDRILESEGDSCNRYKASKQADVLMLFYLFSSKELMTLIKQLGYDFDPDYIPLNIDYYRKRTAHGSTLSQVIHAWVYARSHRKESWKHFRKALMSDFRDIQGGTTHEGIHLGAMAGTLDLIQRCYSGLEIHDNALWLNPRLPDHVKSIGFHIRYRGHWIKLKINHKKLDIHVDKGWAEPFAIVVKGKTHRFETSDKKTFIL